MPKESPEKREKGKTQFWPEIFHFFEQARLLFARVDIGVTEFPTNTAEKEEEKIGSDIFLSKVKVKVGVRIVPFSVGKFHFFGRGKTIVLTFWRGITSKLASQ